MKKNKIFSIIILLLTVVLLVLTIIRYTTHTEYAGVKIDDEYYVLADYEFKPHRMVYVHCYYEYPDNTNGKVIQLEREFLVAVERVLFLNSEY